MGQETTPPRPHWSKRPVSAVFRAEVLEYMRANNILGGLEDISERQAFHYWLQWNGLVGWSFTILEYIRQLRGDEQPVIDGEV